MIAKRIFLLSSGILIAGLSYNVLHVRAAAAGLYTAEQAKRGGTIYQEQCAMCHSTDLAGMGQNPPLKGDDFLSKYQGQTIDLLFDKIQKTMPATKPGSLTRPQTADMVAFLLSSNKYLAGETELPSDADSVKKIQLDKPAQ